MRNNVRTWVQEILAQEVLAQAILAQVVLAQSQFGLDLT
jgi:hypothetical protein